MPAASPSALTAQDIARILSQAEERLRSRGLLRESSADRWGVTLDVSSLGHVTLSGLLRDKMLFEEAARLVREVPGVQGVTGNVTIAENSAPGEPGGVREQIQQKLQSRGLLREQRRPLGCHRGGQRAGDIKLAGALRDVGLRREAISSPRRPRATSSDGRDQRGGQVVRGKHSAAVRRWASRSVSHRVDRVAGCTVDGPPGQGPQGARRLRRQGPSSVEIPRERTGSTWPTRARAPSPSSMPDVRGGRHHRRQEPRDPRSRPVA